MWPSKIGGITHGLRGLFPRTVRRHINWNNQRHRKPEHEPAQDHQKPGPFPQRRRRHQAFVPGLAQCREKVDHATQTMETGAEPVRRPVPGPLSIVNILTMEKRETVAYTEDRTLP